MIKDKSHKSFSKQLKLFPFLPAAEDTAEELGVKLFIVGGFVRDLILKRERKEIDFLIVPVLTQQSDLGGGSGIYFAERYANMLGVKNVIIYKNFGTAHFKYEDYDLEFVGARKESYRKNSRNPKVIEGSFEDDISRRDFTMNTLAVSLNKEDFGELIDTYNGLEDIKNKIIRTPLDPEITFNDDPLRIMRAFRFASQLKFDLDESINIAANKLRERLKIVSQERITDEFLKILESSKPSVGLKLLY